MSPARVMRLRRPKRYDLTAPRWGFAAFTREWFMRNVTLLVAVLGLGVLGMGAAIQTQATGAQPGSAGSAAAPPRVAVVNIETLINGLQERTDRNKEITAKRDAYVAELKTMGQEADAIRSKLQSEVKPGDRKQYFEVRSQLNEKTALLDARDKLYTAQIDLERGEMIQGLYAKALQAIDAMARREGIDLVLMDDRAIDVDPSAGMNSVNAMIQSKRVLYSNDRLDITQRVLVTMNNDYGAGGGHAGAKPAVGGAPGIQPKGKR